MEQHDKHCKSIVEDIGRVIRGEMLKCPECGEMVDAMQTRATVSEDAHGNEDARIYCPWCRNDADMNDWEVVTLWDYFADALDVDYLVGSDRKYKGVRILVACGGPNIYVNTIIGKVTLQWWNESGEAWLPHEYCEEIDAIFSEIWGAC